MGRRREEQVVVPVVRVAPLGELNVFMVTEDELDALGRGSPGTIYLNFALALLPLAIAFLITILSTDIPSLIGQIFFVSSCILCFLVGNICLLLAWHYHGSNTKLVQQIKNRMPPVPQDSRDTENPSH